MKKVIIPAVFILAIAGSAFTRFSNTSQSKKLIWNGYYYDSWHNCQPIAFDDDNCTDDSEFAGYICTELTDNGYQNMFQNELGYVCNTPYWAYFPSN
jgi:hypothetical protein